MRLAVITGTRPETIKMAPVIRQLNTEPGIETVVIASGQHGHLAREAFDLFDIRPNIDLKLMRAGQTLNAMCARGLLRIDKVLAAVRPDYVLVHGDTTTAYTASVAAKHRGIKVAHVEAGLRTYHAAEPWPEEEYRRGIDSRSDLLLAPTIIARDNLRAERKTGRIVTTGNTGIDAMHLLLARLERDGDLRRRADAELPAIPPGTKLVIATVHRRENAGEPFANAVGALDCLTRDPGLTLVMPVHPNLQGRDEALARLGGKPNVHLIDPLGPAPFLRLLQRADLVLTDSGGIQEEACALGRPVVILRNVTERPEAVDQCGAILAGTDPKRILDAARELLARSASQRSTASTVFGDGSASMRIADALLGRPVSEFGAAAAAPP